MELAFCCTSVLIFLCGLKLHLRNQREGFLVLVSGLTSAIYWCKPTNGLFSVPLFFDSFFALLAFVAILKTLTFNTMNVILLSVVVTLYITSWCLALKHRGVTPVQRKCHLAAHGSMLALLANL